MNNTMTYKDYVGSVEFSEKDRLLYGRVLGIRALVSYEGTDVSSLVDDFHNAVDEYLALCEEQNKLPEKAYKGSFNIRISPELHRAAAISALENGISLNTFVEASIRKSLINS